METLAQRLLAVRTAIAAACARAGRDPLGVRLVAVSKTQGAERVQEALAAGQLDFGENYAQELRDKADALPDTVRWHFIGHLQRNKARAVVGRAGLIHTVDSARLAHAVAEAARRVREEGRPGFCQDCLIEVNIGEEPQKGGCLPGEVGMTLDAVAAEAGAVRCLGLMCIPPAMEGDPEQARPCFRRLRDLLEAARAPARPHVELRELSMGMSHDYLVAIEEGATLLRVGTAVFGARPQKAAV